VAAVIRGGPSVVTVVGGSWASESETARTGFGQKDRRSYCIDGGGGRSITWAWVAYSVMGRVVFRVRPVSDPRRIKVKPGWARAGRSDGLPAGFGIVLDDVIRGGWGIAVVLVAPAVGVA